MSISGTVAACDPFPTVKKEVAGCAGITALRTKAAEVMAVNLFSPSMFLHIAQLVPSLELQEACWVPG